PGGGHVGTEGGRLAPLGLDHLDRVLRPPRFKIDTEHAGALTSEHDGGRPSGAHPGAGGRPRPGHDRDFALNPSGTFHVWEYTLTFRAPPPAAATGRAPARSPRPHG